MTTTPERKTPEQIFKAAWHEADERGEKGSRVSAGIAALRAAGLLGGDPTEEQIEQAARAIWERYAGHGPWETLSPERQAPFRKDARAALAAGVAPQDELPVASALPVRDESGHSGDDDRGSREDGPEDEGRSHRTTVAGGPQEPSERVRCDYCGDDLPSVKSRAAVPTTPDLQRRGFAADKVVCPECATRAAPSRDREKLIAELRVWANDPAPEAGDVVPGKVLQSVSKRALAALMAAALVVDEAKLAGAIADELETDDGIAEEWSAQKLGATARRIVEHAVRPALRGGGR